MEAGGSGNRQSGTHSAVHPESYESQLLHPREPIDRHHRDGQAMATATLISPGNPYHGGPAHSFSPNHHSQASGASIAGMISPVEPRRPSDDSETNHHRQSLPSLSEVISGAKPSAFPPSQPSGMTGSSHGFPSHFTSGPSRQYSEPSSEKQSPRGAHPPPSFGHRPESLAPYAEQSRGPAFAARAGPPPPLAPFSGPQRSPPIKPDQPREAEPKVLERNGHYQQHAPPPPPPPPSHPQQHQQHQQHASQQHPPPSMYHQHAPPAPLPPGQVPLPSYSASPRHSQTLTSPYDAPRPAGHPEEGDFAPARGQYDRTLHRALDAWGYADCLHRISHASRTIANFAEAYSRVAAEQHGSHPIPERLPTEREVADMLSNADYMRSSLEAVRQLVQDTNERARSAGKPKAAYEDEDAHMYDGPKPNGYGMTEVKKRRGRAAPPGRCHSCNRIDTPEWRRGPDGARTLCNACGLHYAKLERKRQLEARQIRPKSPQRS